MLLSKSEFRKHILEAEVSAHAKLLIFTLLEYHNEKTGMCYPSQSTLSADCGLCRNTIKKAAEECEKVGLFVIKKKRLTGSRSTVNTYKFPFHCSRDEPSNEPSNEPSPGEHKHYNTRIHNKHISTETVDRYLERTNSESDFKNFDVVSVLNDSEFQSAKKEAINLNVDWHYMVSAYNEMIWSIGNPPKWPLSSFVGFMKKRSKQINGG